MDAAQRDGSPRPFGEWVRHRRAELRIGLRAMALETGIDPGNLSKYERGVLSPPQEDRILRRWADALRLKEGSQEFREFMDLAAVSAGRIPSDLAGDPVLLSRLPILFRAARKPRLSRQELIALAKRIRES